MGEGVKLILFQPSDVGQQTVCWKVHSKYVWSDLRTTYRLLLVGNGPDESVEIPVQSWPQIKVPDNSPQDPRVGLREPLGTGFDGQLSCHVLSQKTQNISFLLCELMNVALCSSHDSQRERQNHKGSRDHPWGEGMLGNF